MTRPCVPNSKMKLLITNASEHAGVSTIVSILTVTNQ